MALYRPIMVKICLKKRSIENECRQQSKSSGLIAGSLELAFYQKMLSLGLNSEHYPFNVKEQTQ